jgi:TM2 domain-containing membrane protein YozV
MLRSLAVILLLLTALKGEVFSKAVVRSPGPATAFPFFALRPTPIQPTAQPAHSQPRAENKRIVAILLVLALGMLGAHRLYLGTKPWIPVFYLLTFGGGFLILPLIDLLFLLFTKDISAFADNPRFFMWLK